MVKPSGDLESYAFKYVTGFYKSLYLIAAIKVCLLLDGHRTDHIPEISISTTYIGAAVL